MDIEDDVIDKIISYLPKISQRCLVTQDNKLGQMASVWYYRTVYISDSGTPQINRKTPDRLLRRNLWLSRPKRRPESLSERTSVDVSYYDKRIEEPEFENCETFARFFLNVPQYRPKRLVIKSMDAYAELFDLVPDLFPLCDEVVVQLESDEPLERKDSNAMIDVPQVVLRTWGGGKLRFKEGVRRGLVRECRNVSLNPDLVELYAVNSNIKGTDISKLIAPKRLHLKDSLFDMVDVFQPSLKSLWYSPYRGQDLSNLTQLEELTIDPVSSLGSVKLPRSLKHLGIAQPIILHDLFGLDALPNLVSLDLVFCFFKNPEQLFKLKFPPRLQSLSISASDDQIFAQTSFEEYKRRTPFEIGPNLKWFMKGIPLPTSLTELSISNCPVSIADWKLPPNLVSLTVDTIKEIKDSLPESLRYLRITDNLEIHSQAFPRGLKELHIYASNCGNTSDGTLDISHLTQLKKLVLKDNSLVELKMPDKIDEVIIKESTLSNFDCPDVKYLHITSSCEHMSLSETLVELEIENLHWKNLGELVKLQKLIAINALITITDAQIRKYLIDQHQHLQYLSLNNELFNSIS